MKRSALRSLVALAVVLAVPANAQDTAATEQQRDLQKLKDELELTKLKNDIAAARLEGFQAQIDALGLPKTEGKTTLEGDGGKLEGWMLASSTLTAAASAIHKSANCAPGLAAPPPESSPPASHAEASTSAAVTTMDKASDNKPAKSKSSSAESAVDPCVSNKPSWNTVILLNGDDVLDLRISRLIQSDINVLERSYSDPALGKSCSELGGNSVAAAASVPAVILVCRTKLTNMNAIHAGKVAAGNSSCSADLAAKP